MDYGHRSAADASTYDFQPVAFNTNNQCQDQLDDILQAYSAPNWSECYDFVMSVIASTNTACEALDILSMYYCEENGSGPLPAPDPEDPNYTLEQIMQFDCYNQIMQILHEVRGTKCYYDILTYVQTHLVLSPTSNACAVLSYILANFECTQDDGYLDEPTAPGWEDDKYEDPKPDEGEEEEEEVDESLREPIW